MSLAASVDPANVVITTSSATTANPAGTSVVVSLSADSSTDLDSSVAQIEQQQSAGTFALPSLQGILPEEALVDPFGGLAGTEPNDTPNTTSGVGRVGVEALVFVLVAVLASLLAF